MSLQGEHLSVPVPTDPDVEQALLALADGSYVLSTPDGVVAECGVGVVALLGQAAEQLAGRRIADVLASASDPQLRATFDRVVAGSRDDAVFPTATVGGTVRSLRLLVVCVPLALGWEFTSLLGELGSRDTDTWHPEALRLRHERALEAVESVCLTGAQPAGGTRLAGILIVVRDADAPPLTREDVGQRMADQRAAARAAVEQARREALGLAGRRITDGLAPDGAGGLEGLVERAHLLRQRVEEAEREATDALAGRERALARLAAIEAQRDAEHDQLELARHELEAERKQLESRVAASRHELERTAGQSAAQRDATAAQLAEAQRQLETERDAARRQIETAQAELERAQEHLRSEQAEREGILARVEGERAQIASRLEAAEAERGQVVARLETAEAERGQVVARLEAAEAERAQIASRLEDGALRASADRGSARDGSGRACADRGSG